MSKSAHLSLSLAQLSPSLFIILIISVFITKEIKLILLCFIMKCGKEPRKTFILQIKAIYKGNKECRKLYLTQSRKEKSDGSMLQLQKSFSEIFIVHKLSSFGQMWPGHIQDQNYKLYMCFMGYSPHTLFAKQKDVCRDGDQ